MSFEGCKNKTSLRFDFCTYSEEDKIKLIEFDGIQHFKPFKRFGGEEGFIKRQERDKIKDIFCINNNIPLLRIRYDEIDIEDKIKKFLFI